MSRREHIACDLDGTAAHYDTWQGIQHIGAPIPGVVDRIKAALARGIDVSIFTARVSGDHEDCDSAKEHVRQWVLAHVGVELPITATKHSYFTEFWDDRAVLVLKNKGHAVFSSPLWLELSPPWER